MANELDPNEYPDNNSFVAAFPTLHRLNPTTGLPEDIPLSGLVGGVGFLSLTPETVPSAAPIDASLSAPLVEVGNTGAYQATMTGAAKSAHILGVVEDGATIWAHWRFGTTFHESYPKTWRERRPTSSG